jgi:hypothetical protein
MTHTCLKIGGSWFRSTWTNGQSHGSSGRATAYKYKALSSNPITLFKKKKIDNIIPYPLSRKIFL